MTDFSLLEIDDFPTAAPTPEPAPVVDAAPVASAPVVAPAPEPDGVAAFAARAIAARVNGQPLRAERQPVALPVAAPKNEARALQDDLLAVEGGNQVTGAVVYWALSGDLDLAKLATEWAAADLPMSWLPSAPSAKMALGLAAKALQSRSLLVRQDPKGGWTFVTEAGTLDEQGKAQLSYDVGPRMFLGGDDGVTLVLEMVDGTNPTEMAVALHHKVLLSYDQNRSTVANRDISAWLVALASKLNAVSLRDHGGVYFVPRTTIDTFRAARTAIKACSAHSIFSIPAMKSADAVAAIIDAVTREAQELVVETQTLLIDDLGSRAAQTRIAAVEKLLEKMASYEKLLGITMAKADILALRTKLQTYVPAGALLEVD